jgi:Domain of unknown function (DUF4132)
MAIQNPEYNFFITLDESIKCFNKDIQQLHNAFKKGKILEPQSAFILKQKELLPYFTAVYQQTTTYLNDLRQVIKKNRPSSLFEGIKDLIGLTKSPDLDDAYLEYTVNHYLLNVVTYAFSYTEIAIINKALEIGILGARSIDSENRKRKIICSESLFVKLLDLCAQKNVVEYFNLLKKIEKKLIQDQYCTVNPLLSVRLATIEEALNNDDSLLVQKFEQDKKWFWFKHSDFDFIKDRSNTYKFFNKIMSFNPNIDTSMEEVTGLYQRITPSVFDKLLTSLLYEISKDSLAWFRRGQNDFLIPLLKFCGEINTQKPIEFVAKITDLAYIRVPGSGSASSTLGNVGLEVLIKYPSVEKTAMLYNMKNRTKNPYFLDALELKIQELKNKFQYDEDEIQDKYIENYGFESDKMFFEFGDYHASVTIINYDDIDVQWFKTSENKPLKSEPSSLKKSHSEDIKDFKLLLKSIKKTQSTERMRLEKSWLNARTWDWETWNQYLRNHSIVSKLVGTLIWQFEENGQILRGIPFSKEKIIDSNNKEIILEKPTVCLWHPISSTIQEIQAWRNFLFDNQVKQPIKQAFRELYLVTDAEINTVTYSNRFLNHVLGHQKMKAIATQRLWEYRSVYEYDPPCLLIPRFNIKAWFDIESDYEYVQVGRTHFQLMENPPRALRMEEVPSIVFSEAMRDIDLFVSKSTIGIEENWHERAQTNAQYNQYWQNYNQEKELSTTAKIRREVLERIIPKLKISDKCGFDGPHLTVKGIVNNYRIHIESGNSYLDDMRYLCIVPTRENSAVFLPFEGDSILSVIISKAFLLAADDKITDSTITRQIRI